jgi:hypothetical protein
VIPDPERARAKAGIQEALRRVEEVGGLRPDGAVVGHMVPLWARDYLTSLGVHVIVRGTGDGMTFFHRALNRGIE